MESKESREGAGVGAGEGAGKRAEELEGEFIF